MRAETRSLYAHVLADTQATRVLNSNLVGNHLVLFDKKINNSSLYTQKAHGHFFLSIGCGGHLMRDSGTINFPTVMGEQAREGENCGWLITTQSNMVIACKIV